MKQIGLALTVLVALAACEPLRVHPRAVVALLAA